MGLGLPLLAAFTPDEMRGVIAHEYGHFSGGDTRLGPWVYRTRGALLRTLQNLERGRATLDGSLLLALVRQPFTGYYRFFMRISQSVSRAQELAADRLGARVAGAPAMASGLAKLEFTSLAFELFLHSEFLPLVQRGLRAPLAAGFQEFLAVPRVREEVDRTRARMQAWSRRDPYDSHPPVPERLRALGVDPGGGAAASEPERALGWFADPATLETQLLEFKTPGTQHRRIEWAQVASTVVAPDWEQLCRPHAALLETLTIGELAATARGARALADRLALPPAARERPESFARALLAAALGLALQRAGWELRVSLGNPLQLVSGAEVLEPRAAVEELAEQRRPEQDWRAWCEQAGVAGLRLWPAGASA
jgi:hypothetical protein